MQDIVVRIVKKMWKGAKYCPDIIVELEKYGIKVSEKTVIDTAKRLGLKGADVYSRIFKHPEIIDKWWKDFEKREEESAMKLLQRKNIKGMEGVGNARHIAGCTIADELNERGVEAQEIINTLLDKGFEAEEIERIRKDVGF
ncbi:MAG: hypothetical protein J7K68_01710 [Candidatus Diapherotrites archaeon]|nr:hypothetical protein [Candidatus Diapherotrites archaeon]